MMRNRMLLLAFPAAGLASEASAQAARSFGMQESMMAGILRGLIGRLDQIIASLPALGAYLAGLPQQFGWRQAGLLIGIVVAGLAAEWLARTLLQKVRVGLFERHAGESPLRAFFHGAWLDAAALLALWIAAAFVARHAGAAQGVHGALAHQFLLGLLYWRGFNFVFRIWLRPNTPEGRIAPVDDATAQRLLVALNVVIVLPLLLRQMVLFMQITGAAPEVLSAAVVLAVPVVSAGLVYAVWHWRHEMAAWLAGMVNPRSTFHALKIGLAHSWWVMGLAFYLLSALAAILAALTESAGAMHGIARIESMLILLLLFETLLHRLTHHLPLEVPTVADVVAGLARLAVRLVVIVVAAEAFLLGALGVMEAAEWEPHARAIRLAAISTFAAYAIWRFLKYRMDRYIADNPLPSAGFDPDADEDAPAAASRLRTIMPVMRVTVGVTILILGSLLVLSQLSVNITPLIAGASVLGLAVSFGSQSLVRDIVSGIFFLAEDSFRVGEYIDGTKVKGTVEGFSVRSIRLRHQNGQLHIVPFGQLTHITNFSRDWTTVKFNLAFGLNTDIELLRKTVKKIGIDMMAEPAYQKELLQPLKMQGIVDIKDASLVVRFKFTAKPKNPSLIQRVAIRRMYETFPTKDIHFALPPIMFPGQTGGHLASAPPPTQSN
ncbi:MAG TPA: mechanosensitive ion channel domain-containing protein [Reyranella sp.]|nr:mechanosensitive ion channel domain-containing protein [Reyranella sp.]